MTDDLAFVLQAAGVGTLGTDLYGDEAPAFPDAVVVVYTYPGPPPIETHDDQYPRLEQPRAQVVVRDLDYATAESRSYSAWRALGSVVNRLVNGVMYLRVRPAQSPYRLDRDDANRWVFAFNVEIERIAP